MTNTNETKLVNALYEHKKIIHEQMIELETMKSLAARMCKENAILNMKIKIFPFESSGEGVSLHLSVTEQELKQLRSIASCASLMHDHLSKFISNDIKHDEVFNLKQMSQEVLTYYKLITKK